MKSVIIAVEPSKRMSELLGFPYIIEKRVSLEELLEDGTITDADVRNMELGKTVEIRLPVK